ncbi:MAG: phosphoribosylformylglycinamidine cyclo-ligase [Planctomycetaceae bacterium]
MAQLSYESAGVNLQLYEQAMQKLPKLMRQTQTAGVMDLPGGFAGLFRLTAIRQWNDPVLVSGTDGVGTKIKVAIMLGRYDTIGIDLVAMCVNDCLCLGAVPLFFLDYIAMARDNPPLLEQLVSGVSAGCQQAEAALLGGETAIMPDLYADGDFDMAGFCVAAAERSELINGTERIAPGDVLIGVPSSGFHSNGYSLIRKAVFEHAGLAASDTVAKLENRTVGDVLLTPTRIYASLVSKLLHSVSNDNVHGIAHITGGGIVENLERVLPASVEARLRHDSWTVPTVFRWLEELGDIAEPEMFRVFNMGVGLVVAVAPEVAESAVAALSTDEFPAFVIGEVAAGDGTARFNEPN